MNILAIDIGTYSVKFTELKPERKSFIVIDQQELIIDDIRCHYPEIDDVTILQKEIVANYIQQKTNDVKIIFQLPSEMITTRFLDIPAPNRKKAEQIIPFQLDDNLPYSLNDAHYASSITKVGNSFKAISNIAKLTTFDQFYNLYKESNVIPQILTTEISLIQNYIDHKRFNENCCIIDIGHKTTKAYFIRDRRVISNHISHIAGANITDVISKTYQISHDDAVIYKHANAYFLTDDQMKEVNEEQQDFALLMKQILNPLVADIKRWDIGHRVKFGSPIEKIYLLGGTSEINNIETFLESHLGIKVSKAPSISDFRKDHNKSDSKYLLTKMMGISGSNPQSLVNMLTGDYQSQSNNLVSAHSTAFIATRVAAVCLIISLGLTIERFAYLNKIDKQAEAKVTNILKRNNLGLSPNEKRAYRKTPQRVLSLLKKRSRSITDEVSMISSAQDINAMRPLGVLSQIISKNDGVVLESFRSDGIQVSAIFTSTNSSNILALSRKIKDTNFLNLQTRLSDNQTKLTISFEDEK